MTTDEKRVSRNEWLQTRIMAYGLNLHNWENGTREAMKQIISYRANMLLEADLNAIKELNREYQVVVRAFEYIPAWSEEQEARMTRLEEKMRTIGQR